MSWMWQSNFLKMRKCFCRPQTKCNCLINEEHFSKELFRRFSSPNGLPFDVSDEHVHQFILLLQNHENGISLLPFHCHKNNSDGEDESAKIPEETGEEKNEHKEKKNQKIIEQKAKKANAKQSENDEGRTELRQDFGSEFESKANEETYRENKVAAQKFSGQFSCKEVSKTISTECKGHEKSKAKIYLHPRGNQTRWSLQIDLFREN